MFVPLGGGTPLRYPYPMAEQTGWQGERLTIGLLGGGTVGAAVARGLASRAEEWGIGIAGIAVRDLAKAQAAGLDRIAPLTTDPAALAASDDVDVVVEIFFIFSKACKSMRHRKMPLDHIIKFINILGTVFGSVF